MLMDSVLLLVIVAASALVGGVEPHRIAASRTSTRGGNGVKVTAELGHRRLSAVGDSAPQYRHNKRPANKRVVLDYPVSKFSHLMASDCRPTQNGFFGSTSGTPAVIQYGFGLETTVFADIDRILDIIDEHVMDEVLSHTFSKICSTPDRRKRKLSLTSVRSSPKSGHVTGFKFEEETMEESATCDPEIHPKNSCAYYMSSVKVFGQNMDRNSIKEILDLIRVVLPESLANASKFGAVRLVLADDLTEVVSVPPSVTLGESKRVHPGAAAGLVIAFLVLLVSVFLLIVYCRYDRKEDLLKKPSKGSKNMPTMHGHGPTRRERDFLRYLDGRNNDGSLTNTLPATDSDSSGRESSRREALQRYSEYHRSQQPPMRLPGTDYDSPDSFRREAMQRFSEYQRSQQQAAGKNQRQRKKKNQIVSPRHRNQRQALQQQQQQQQQMGAYLDDNLCPVVLEFGKSFDPERDRFMRDMEEESSAPPSYMFDPNAPPDFMFVYDEYERYGPYAEQLHLQQQEYEKYARRQQQQQQQQQHRPSDEDECEFVISEIQII